MELYVYVNYRSIKDRGLSDYEESGRHTVLSSTIRPRIDDMGPSGHVHNTVLPAWFQEARQALLVEFLTSPDEPALPLMVKEYTVTFHRELMLTPDVEIDISVERVGNSSFVLHEAASQNDQVAAESRVVYIHVGDDNRPASIPARLREVLERHLRVAEDVRS